MTTDIDITALDRDTTYVLIIDPETTPHPDQLAPLLQQLHEHEVHALVLVGSASMRPADTELVNAAQRLIDPDTEFGEDERTELAQLLVSTAVHMKEGAA